MGLFSIHVDIARPGRKTEWKPNFGNMAAA